MRKKYRSSQNNNNSKRYLGLGHRDCSGDSHYYWNDSLVYVQSLGNISATTTTTGDWTSSGPFSINKQDYTFDEKIFFVTSEIGYDEKSGGDNLKQH